MGRRRRRHDALFDDIARFPALIDAARNAARGKRRSPSAAAFLCDLEPECLRLERQLRSGRWRPGRYAVFRIRDPKPRRISAAPFRDRVVHHALCGVIGPLFEAGFVDQSFANRRGKGAHRAVASYERGRRRASWVLRADIYRYFPAVDHEILKADLRRRISCARTLKVLDAIIDGANPQEPVNNLYPGDDLLTPLERRRGLPIGNLTSQLFANVFLDPLDHFITERLRPRHYVRYVDDFAVFDDDAARLSDAEAGIAEFLARRRLSLHPQKTRIQPIRAPADFLGYRIDDRGRRLPEANVRRFRNRLRGLRDRWRAGSIDEEEVRCRVMSWIAHAEQADTLGLRRAIFGEGWFCPDRLARTRQRRRSLTGPYGDLHLT